MLKNFDDLKKQLEELAPVINSFESEAVQLRVVDLILQGEKEEGRHTSSGAKESGTRPKKKRVAGQAAGKQKGSGGTARKKGTGGKIGPASILSELIEENFFGSKRTIKAIIDHSSSQKARIFKANELSGPLARFVRDKRLKREKNSDGQYEYFL